MCWLELRESRMSLSAFIASGLDAPRNPTRITFAPLSHAGWSSASTYLVQRSAVKDSGSSENQLR